MGQSDGDDLTFGQKISREWRDFREFLYNSETGKVMGRSGTSWAKIGGFYLLFYGFLAGFFTALLFIFYTTIDKPGIGGPKLIQYIENKPGLTRLDRSSKLQSYSASNNDRISSYKTVIDEFLDGYNTSDHSGALCGAAGTPKSDKPCIFDTTLLGECAPSKNTTYGLREKKPCIFIKINKVFGWTPADDGTGYLTLSCTGHATVMPQGFPLTAFPYNGHKVYQSPIVAVKIDATKGKKNVDCTLKGKNIEVSNNFNPSRAFGKIRIEGISATD